MIGMIRQAGIADPARLLMPSRILHDLLRVVAVFVHAKRQGFNALQGHKVVQRRDGCPGIAQRTTRAPNIGGLGQRLGINHAMIGRVELVQPDKALRVFCPGKVAGIHDDAAEGGAVAAWMFDPGQ